MWEAFANAKATHIFFSKNISIYAIFNDQNFNDVSLVLNNWALDNIAPEHTCFKIWISPFTTLEPALVAQLDVPSDWRPGGRGFNPRRGQQHSFVEIDHEIFSTVILSLPLIQEGQLSVSGERMCTILVNRLED